MGDRPFFDFTSYGRRGPGLESRLSPGQIAHIERTVRRTAEVMVKISGGGGSVKAVAAHFNYLTRREFEAETDDGQQLKGRESVKALLDDWELDLDAIESRRTYKGIPGRKPQKLVHNIVLSMPAGTPAAGVLKASRNFAREEFGLKHRYALVLHTDQPHPHVHLVLKAMDEEGKRINIRKETLREWRRQFAKHLREEGIAANATTRAVRGAIRVPKKDGIYRATRAGRSEHLRKRVESVVRAIQSRNFTAESGKTALVATRKSVVQGWLDLRATLWSSGATETARGIEEFLKQMPPAHTEREQIATKLMERTQHRKEREEPTRSR